MFVAKRVGGFIIRLKRLDMTKSCEPLQPFFMIEILAEPKTVHCIQFQISTRHQPPICLISSE